MAHFHFTKFHVQSIVADLRIRGRSKHNYVFFLMFLIKPQCVLLQLGDVNQQEWKSDL